ncbi:cell cycle checkpoint control protein RAD9A [Anopheles nili]|uniref:cell cycle checkpoint control protein RAD9A n=1 Tax=Anopheles nili TaxID=185578 RepID=UPI00237BDF2F|nr:cell cycle checkpoint control protein RAD9A [Anopheles nili]
MNFILPGANVKILARTVNCFSKIGTELFFEATPSGLDLKTINPTNTAYAIAQFKSDFFISFQQGAQDTPDENCCKISVKPILKIFKNLATIQTCKIWLDITQSKIIFQFRCKSDVLKTHKIYLLESEHVNSLNLPDTMPSEIVGNHKVFTNILMHLYTSVDEITFDLKEDNTIVSNYVDNEESDRSTLRSTLAINPSAFQLYQLSSNANLTFCFKEFKAITMLAALCRLNIQMNFSAPGSPIMLQMTKGETVHMKFIMGTMQPSAQLSGRRAHRRKQAELNTSHRSIVMDSEGINTCLTDDITCNANMETSQTHGQPRLRKPSRDATNRSLRAIENESDLGAARSVRVERQREADSVHDLRQPCIAPSNIEPESEVMFVEHNVEPNPFLSGLNIRNPSVNRLDSLPSLSVDSVTVNSRRRSQTGDASMLSRKRPQPASPPSELNQPPQTGDTIPESPDVIEERQRKQAKLRHIFRRCFEPTFHPAMQPGCSQIFAPNSDTEDDW